jgi:hypothetical protein
VMATVRKLEAVWQNSCELWIVSEMFVMPLMYCKTVYILINRIDV